MSSLSPLRYPGGKGKLFPRVSKIIVDNKLNNKIYVEPFAGGCGLVLKILKNKLAKSIIINDYDYCVYAFWYSILNYKDEFINKILNTNINLDEWENQRNIYLNYKTYNILDVGFATFFLNRTNYSGILKSGPIGGKKQLSNYKLDCRFNKADLINKIEFVYSNKDFISLYNLEANDLIKDVIKNNHNNYFINFDPPYYTKGPELYKNFFNDENHRILKDTINNCKSKWILTYDYCEFIDKLYRTKRKEIISLNYSTKKSKLGQELLIYSKDLIA